MIELPLAQSERLSRNEYSPIGTGTFQAPHYEGQSEVVSMLGQYGRRPSSRIVKWAWRFWGAICLWFQNCFPSKKNEEVPLYYKVVSNERGGVKFRMLRKGKKTDNVLRLGPNTAVLSSVSTSDSWAHQALSKTLQQIMRDENIDEVQTRNLSYAKVLWKAGLATEANLCLKIFRPTQTEHFFLDLVKFALVERERLDTRGARALEIIEEQIVMMIVSDAFHSSENLSFEFQNAIFFFQDVFPGIDMQLAARRLKEKQKLPTSESMIDHFIFEIPHASNHVTLSVPASIELSFSSLCALSSSLERPFNGQVSQSSNRTITFTKEQSHAY